MSTVTANRALLRNIVRTKLSLFITPQSTLKGSSSTIAEVANAASLYGALVDGQTTHWAGGGSSVQRGFQQFDDHPTQTGPYTYGPAAFAGSNTPWFDATNANINAPLDRWRIVRNAGGGTRGTLVVYGDPGWSHPVQTSGTTAIGATTINVVSTQAGSIHNMLPASGTLTNAAGASIAYTGTTDTSITGVTGITTAIPSGTKLWEKPTNAATQTFALAAPSFMDQRILDLIHFLEQIKIFNGGVMPINALAFRQEHKGRLANGLGSGRAWEALDRTPETWTPADDNNHLSFFAWAHCLYWNKMFTAVRAHPDPDINGLKLVGPYIAYGGINPNPGGVHNATNENNHSYPLGSEDGSVAPWEWDDQPTRYFLKYSFHDENTAFAADFSNRDNGDTTGLGADDTYAVSRNVHKRMLTRRIRSFMAEFAWETDEVEYLETYFWVNISGCDSNYSERQQAAYELMDHINHWIEAVDWVHEWAKDGDLNASNQMANKASWVRQSYDSTHTTNSSAGLVTATGPGTKFLAYDYVLALKTNFPLGTQLVDVTTDDARLVPIASTTKTLVLNTASVSVTFTLEGVSRTLPAYSFAVYASVAPSLSDALATMSDSLVRSAATRPRALSSTLATMSDSLVGGKARGLASTITTMSDTLARGAAPGLSDTISSISDDLTPPPVTRPTPVVTLVGQDNYANATGIDTRTITLTGPVKAGDGLFLVLAAGSTTAASVSVSDSKGNTWDLANNQFALSSSNVPVQVAARITNPLVAGDTVTFTFRASPAGAGAAVAETRIVAFLARVTQVNPTGVLLDGSTRTGGTTGTSQTPGLPGGIADGSQLLIWWYVTRIGLVSGDSGDLDKITSVPAGWTELARDSAFTTNGIQVSAVYRITRVAPSVTATFTLDDATHAWRTFTAGWRVFAAIPLADSISSFSDSLGASAVSRSRALTDNVTFMSDTLARRFRTAKERRPHARASMRMTDRRYTYDKTGWPGSRTTVSDYASLAAAIAAGQKVTLADGVTFAGADLVLPSGADIRCSTYLAATMNANLILDDATGVTLEGFRVGTGRSIFGARPRRCSVRWILAGGGGTTDYGIRLVDPSGCELVGCYTRNQRVYGQALLLSTPGVLPAGYEPCSVRYARWEKITHTVPVLDGVSEIGLRVEVPALINGCDGFGSAWSEISIVGGGVVAKNLRLSDARIGIDIVGGAGVVITAARIWPSLYGIQTATSGPQLAGGLLEDIYVDGGIWGINLEQPANPVVDNFQLRGQAGAGIRQHAGNALIDFGFSEISPAPGGVRFLYQP